MVQAHLSEPQYSGTSALSPIAHSNVPVRIVFLIVFCLLAVEREPGCELAVSILELSEAEAGPMRRPSYGPIP